MKINKVQNKLSFNSLTNDKIINNLGEYILNFRRPFKKEKLSYADRGYLFSVVRDKILPFIVADKPIEMAIVGFSLKCPSPQKVVSQNADRAEFESLKHLNRFVTGFSDIYPPGANLDIYTDGRIFARTIIGFTDEKVSRYVEQLKTCLKKLNAKRIKVHTPEDFVSGSFDEIRGTIFKHFPPNIPQIKTDTFSQEYRRFMRDFYAKDIRAQDSTISIKQSKTLGERVADSVINLADSYSTFVASLYKTGMLRLSVHAKPVYDANQKIGVFLNELKINCPMPWHSAAAKLYGRDVFLFEKKSVLEQTGAQFIENINEEGCFYKLPEQMPLALCKYF